MKYPIPKEGELISPYMAPRSYKLRCCDCGLVHRLVFRVAKLTKRLKNGYWIGKPAKRHKVMFKAYRDYRATAACRRKKL